MSKDLQLALAIDQPAFAALGGKTGFIPEADISLDELSTLLSPATAHFIARGTAETDERFKQIIPYAILVVDDKILGYTRAASGGEDRLHGKISIGVGGHIDAQDGVFADGVLMVGSTIVQAGSREIDEEVPGIASITKTETLGFIYDDSEPVGRVHLGVVSVLEADRQDVWEYEADLEKCDFFSLDFLEANASRLENWSALVLPALRAYLPKPPVL